MMLALLLADQNGMPEAVARQPGEHHRRRLVEAQPGTTGGIACCRSQRANAEAELLLKQGKRDAAPRSTPVEGRLIEAVGRKPDMPQIRTLLATVQASMAASL